MLTPQDNKKILALYTKINAIYKEAKQRSSGKECHICGAGDFTTKNNVVLKVKGIVKGYELRPHESPHLCHRHNGGWTISLDAYNLARNRTDTEIDLHFAAYVAKQILKESKK